MSLLLKSFSVKEGEGLQQRRTQSKGTVSSEWLKSFLFSSFNRALVFLLPSLRAVHYLHALFSFTHSTVLVWLHDKGFSYRVLILKFSWQQSLGQRTHVFLPTATQVSPEEEGQERFSEKNQQGTPLHMYTPHWLSIPAVRDGTYWLDSIPSPRIVTLVHLAWSD